VLSDPQEVRRVAERTIEWMRSLSGSSHPLAPYVGGVIAAWDAGLDLACYGAPHLVIAHVPTNDEPLSIDAVIGIAHVDVLAPAFGVGACWAGFVSLAALAGWAPLIETLALPEGRVFAYALLCGRPRFTSPGIPRRAPLRVEFR